MLRDIVVALDENRPDLADGTIIRSAKITTGGRSIRLPRYNGLDAVNLTCNDLRPMIVALDGILDGASSTDIRAVFVGSWPDVGLAVRDAGSPKVRLIELVPRALEFSPRSSDRPVRRPGKLLASSFSPGATDSQHRNTGSSA